MLVLALVTTLITSIVFTHIFAQFYEEHKHFDYFSKVHWYLYEFIPMHSCDYLFKNLIVVNLLTKQGNGWN